MSKKGGSCCKGARLGESHRPYCFIAKKESAAKLRAIQDEAFRRARLVVAQKEK